MKLEDNKVAEWNDKYVRYDKLKNILAKCAKSIERYNNLHARNPDLAATVEERYRKGMPTPRGSKENLLAGLSSSAGVVDTERFSIHSIDEQDEATVLSSSSPTSPKDYGSGAPTDMHREDSAGRLFSVLERAASGVSEFFDFEKKYERQLVEALKAMDQNALEFEKSLLEDIELVNKFYEGRLAEFEGRLKLLKESVAVSFARAPPPPDAVDEGGTGRISSASENSVDSFLETPLIGNTRKKANTLIMAVKTISMHLKPQAVRELETTPMLPINDDDEEQHHQAEDDARKAREADSVQRSLADLYRHAKLLSNYYIMNYTAVVKIVKKHDKTLREHKGRFKNVVKPANICNEGKAVEKLADHLERLYANWFCNRSITEARVQLLPKKGDGLEMDWSQLRLGYRMGMCSVLSLWVGWDCIWGTLTKGTATIGGRTAFPVFRACGGLLLLQWFWGCSVWVWTRYRVNYIFLFDFDPQIVSTPLAIFNEAVDNSLVFLVGMLLYYKAGANDLPINFPAGILPFLLVVYMFLQLIFPLRSRRPMWRAIWHVVSTPLSSPTFFHGYLGDIFTSMVKVFQDIAWTLGFVLSGDFLIPEEFKASTKHAWAKSLWYSKVLIPILTLLPLWFRFNQCLRRYTDTGNRMPHLANAFKYALSMTVTLFGAFHPLYLRHSGPSNLFQMFWMTTFVASSLYSFFWDVYMDWGLGRPKYNFLGPRLMYPRKDSYYATIGIDLVLRFAWVLTLVPPNSGARFALPQYLTAVSMMLELFRRTIWGFLRLENEHRSNTSGYRRVDFVPLHFSTEHGRGYKHEKEHRGASVLVEVAVVTLVVLGAAVASVVAAQHETEKLLASNEDL